MIYIFKIYCKCIAWKFGDTRTNNTTQIPRNLRNIYSVWNLKSRENSTHCIYICQFHARGTFTNRFHQKHQNTICIFQNPIQDPRITQIPTVTHFATSGTQTDGRKDGKPLKKTGALQATPFKKQDVPEFKTTRTLYFFSPWDFSRFSFTNPRALFQKFLVCTSRTYNTVSFCWYIKKPSPTW